MKKVLITGMSGLIGGLLRGHLEQVGGYELTALNRRAVEGVSCYRADIADLEAMKPAFEGQDVVVHLAAQLGDDPWETLVSSNLIGTYNVYEAARLAGVGRVIFASSGSAIKGWERVAPYDAIASGRYDDVPESWPIITTDMVRPHGAYGASKVWGEALGRHFSDVFDLSVLCVRIGSVTSTGRPQTAQQYSSFLSHRDVVDILRRCIEAPDGVKYGVFYALSNNRWGYRDLEPSRKVLGYEPQDSAEAFR